MQLRTTVSLAYLLGICFFSNILVANSFCFTANRRDPAEQDNKESHCRGPPRAPDDHQGEDKKSAEDNKNNKQEDDLFLVLEKTAGGVDGGKILPARVASKQRSLCADDEDYEIILIANGKEKKCDWIAKKQVRKNKYCSTVNNGHLVSDMCPVTCGVCGCVDDEDFEIILIANGKEKKCDWIAKKQVRKNKYCSTVNNGHLVSDMCPVTCDACGPTAPTPTTPSPPTSSCADDEDFEIITSLGKEKKCDWIAKKQVRKNKYCSTVNNGHLVSDMCPVTCDACGPTAPTPTTPSPPTSSCVDDEDYEIITSLGKEKKCDWIAKKQVRKNKYCSTVNNGHLVSDMCPVTCDVCGPTAPSPTTPSPPTSSCADDPEYDLLVGGEDFSCSWIAEVASRKEEYCSTVNNGHLVSDKCPVTCDACGPTAPTPTVPSPTTPSPPTSSCADDPEYDLLVGGEDFSCSWIAEVASRKEEYCSTVNNGHLVSDKCPVTCDACGPTAPTPTVPSPTTPSPPTSSCADDPEYDLLVGGEDFSCSWIAEVASRKEEYCSTVNNGHLVSDKCPVTCNSC